MGDTSVCCIDGGGYEQHQEAAGRRRSIRPAVRKKRLTVLLDVGDYGRLRGMAQKHGIAVSARSPGPQFWQE